MATVIILICPESPRWHLVNGRAREAIEAFNRIAEMNGVKEGQKGRIPLEAKFVEDPTNYDVTVDMKTKRASQRASSVFS